MGLFEPHGRHRGGDGQAALTVASFLTIDDMPELSGKRVLVREDLNVPMADGHVSDATRLAAAVPTLAALADRGAIVLVLSHFGRPKGVDRSCTLRSVVPALGEQLGRPVVFIADCVGADAEAAVAALAPGSVAVLENTRFHAGEAANDPAFVAALARLGDFYVNDAFSTAHRAHASTEGLAHRLPAFAGRSMQAELTALENALGNPQHPVAAVVGGAKVSSKLDVLTHLVSRVDHLMIGGGMANTFLAAKGIDVGKSLCEHDLAPTVLDILARAEAAGCTVHLPYDVVVAKQFAANAPHRTANVHDVAADEMILDLGASAVEALGDALKICKTLVWNGPLGAFETPPFDMATVALARIAGALTQSGSLLSVAGGGDTVAALNHAGVAGQFSFVSVAGGAFLEWMEGKPLPGVDALKRGKP
jgi:phosphoglycerate kinase